MTVRQALDHSAGVPGLPAGVTVEDACDWPTMVAALEDATPWWEPGTAVGYHAYTFGYLVGEIARRASGRELSDLLTDLTTGIGVPAGAKVTASALARMYTGWLDGTVVSRELAPGAYTESSSGEDRAYGNPGRWGLGFALGLPFDGVDAPNTFGMAGAGGSWAGADPDRGIAVAVTKNVLSRDFETVQRLVGAVYAAV